MGDAVIRCDGLYKRDTGYLRFYPEGVVVETGDSRSVEQVAAYLTRDLQSDYVARGTYQVEGNVLKAFLERCPPRRSYGYMTLTFEGTIAGDTLTVCETWDEPDVSDYGPPAYYTGGSLPDSVYVFVPAPVA